MKKTKNTKEHELKVWPEFYAAVADGTKTFEVRENDRGFKVGDILILREFRPCSRCYGSGRERLDAWDEASCGCRNPHGKYTGRKLKVCVTFITDFKQLEDYVVMAIKPLLRLTRLR